MTELRDAFGRPRVVVTGMGVKTPAGVDVDTMWSTVLAGRGTAKPIERFDASELPVRFAGEVLAYDPEDYFGPKEVRRVDRFTQLGFGAAADAVADAGELGADPSRIAVIAATGVGGLETMETNEATFLERGASRVSPFFVPMMMPNAAAGMISIRFGFTGPALCLSTACAAGANALGEGVRMVRDGSAEIVVAGATEAPVTPLTVSAFARMGAMSTRNDDPARASRPFDAERDGFVIAEGAAFCILETMEHALGRGATIHGEILGYGRNADAHHITAPVPGGAGAAACMQLALDDAGLDAADIGHVNAHGTSTPLNDATEAEAIRKVFSDAAPPVTSTKGVTGHMIAGAGAAEAVISMLSLRDGVVPPTANLDCIGEDIGLDVVSGSPRPIDRKPVLSNSFGFGGHNATLILGPAEPASA
ncbi:MAG: 3-oxoacyl-[acyl-carrier-protein] synthase [Actinomycetota bacterium]|nr:3-oxoacyl-[acyl-carrier-protein] synthase [Actinomycetota bacterium]